METGEPEIVVLARRWLSYSEELKKQIHGWKHTDEMAREELEIFFEERNSAEEHDQGAKAAPFGMKHGYRRFSTKPKSIKLKITTQTEEI